MDMNDMLQQAQKMQLELARAQEEIKELTYTATSGGGSPQALFSPAANTPSQRFPLKTFIRAVLPSGHICSVR